ncbi:MAG: hypothetical protein QGG53_40820 [Planctomycetota bacterium]|nr:hypothetical protein [Planctomycetota bacterium]
MKLFRHIAQLTLALSAGNFMAASGENIARLNEESWLLEVSALEPDERRESIAKALKTYDRGECGLLLGAMLSGDEELELLLPDIHRQVRSLVRPCDADILAEKVAAGLQSDETIAEPGLGTAIRKTSSTRRHDWVIDLLGFCREQGFARLKRLHSEHDDRRVRIGAIRAMANLLAPEAIDYVSKVTAKTQDTAEREAARFAQSELRWRTGRLKKPLPDALRPLPLVSIKDGPARIREALKAGGTLVVEPSLLSAEVSRMLKELGAPLPQDGKQGAPQRCIFSVPDFHRLFAYPFDFLCADVTALVFADYSWGKWSKGQSATLRLRDNAGRAAAIVQEGVLGKGRVVFSGLSAHNPASAARLGIPDRDPWHENLMWHHGDRNPDRHLYLWRAREGFTSQHRPWGTPLPVGAFSAAFITPNFNGRDPIELAQRLEMDYEHFPYMWAPKRGVNLGLEEGRLTPVCFGVLEQVFSKPRDVVILAGRTLPGKASQKTWSVLPARLQETLLQVCRDRGTGLVIIGERGPMPMMTQESKLAAIVTPFGPIERSQWGKGRIIATNRPGRAPAEFVTPGAFHPITRVNHYDYWAAEVAKQIAWAAGRETPIQIGKQVMIEGGSVVISVENKSEENHDCTVEVAFRNLAGTVAAEGRSKLHLDAGAKKEVRIAIGGLSSGRFVAEITARNGKGASLGWNWGIVDVKGPVVVTDLKFEKPMVRPGEELSFSLVHEGAIPEATTATASIIDRYGRLCGRSEQRLGPDHSACTVKVARPLWRYVSVRVALTKDGKTLAAFEKPWIVDVPPPQKDFPYAAWSKVGKQASLVPMIHQAGIDWLNKDFELCLSNGVLPWVLNFGGLGLGYHAPAMNYQRNPTPMGPTFHQWRLNVIPQKVPGMLRAGVAAIIDQDEESLGGEYGFHPASLHEFRKQMRTEYGSLEALNKVWETKYEKWREVMPLRLAQVKGRDSLAPMVDLRMFMDTAYLHHVEFDRFICESLGMRGVKLGLSTSGGGFDDGWDIWKASKMFTCMIRQHTGNREKFRSWRRPDMALGRWTGGYYPDDVASGHFMPWHQLFHGSTIYATWGGGIGFYMSIWRPDGTPRDGIAAAAKELSEIRSGPATLIRNSRRVPPQIGIHYSRASQLASKAEWRGATWGAASTIRNVLEMKGHQYRWISYEELGQGFCDTWPGKCLFLPVSTCLSKSEVASVRRFVERGGTVIADCDPGTRDDHGGRACKGQLTELFGCEWIPAPAQAKGLPAKATLEVPNVPPEIEIAHSYRRIARATTGKPHGTVSIAGKQFPTWITHTFGKGKTITLNFLPGRSKSSSVIIEALLAAAGVSHEVQVLKDGREIPGVERFSFQDGNTRYTGIVKFASLRRHWGPLRLPEEAKVALSEVTVHFPAGAHLYNVRSKEHLGETVTVATRLEAGVAQLYAQLPYKVEKLELLPATKARAGNEARIAARVIAIAGEPGAHSLRFQVFEPSGRERKEYGGVRRFAKGRGEWLVPFAPNDPPGGWRVRVSDAVSGVRAERTWELTK